MRYDAKRVLIVGLGESGRAAARFFVSRGAQVSATDTRPDLETLELESLGVELHLGGHPDSLFSSHDLIVPSPGVPWNLPQLQAARAGGVEVSGELEIAAGELEGKVIGVSGTNGKTTTTSWIGRILERAGVKVRIAGNIGTPVLSIVDESSDDQWTVLELSSFQLEAMQSFRCHVAAILNITPDHLDRHGDMATYSAAKARILVAQQSGDTAVLNADDPNTAAFTNQVHGSAVFFSRDKRSDGAWVEDDTIVLNGRRICSTRLPLPGPHNLENALAAVCAANCAGISDEDIAAGLAGFQGVEHRLELVRSLKGVAYFNDSKATNVDAAIKAVESFEQGLWLILGGRDKGGDFRPLSNAIRGRTREVLLIGEAASKIRSQLNGAVIREFEALSDAVEYAQSRATEGDTVLLAPACASFDQFENYEERGNMFKRLAEKLF